MTNARFQGFFCNPSRSREITLNGDAMSSVVAVRSRANETAHELARRNASSVSLTILLVIQGCSNAPRSYDETIRRGNLVVRALEQYHADRGQYPTTLSELVPDFIDTVPQPTWGLKKWEYHSTRTDFDIRVDESSRTGDGDALYLRFYRESLKWDVGD